MSFAPRIKSSDMAGIKRKDGPKTTAVEIQKKQKVAKPTKTTKPKSQPVGADLPESDTTEDDDDDDFGGFGDDDAADAGESSMSDVDDDDHKSAAKERPKEVVARDGFKSELAVWPTKMS